MMMRNKNFTLYLIILVAFFSVQRYGYARSARVWLRELTDGAVKPNAPEKQPVRSQLPTISTDANWLYY